ncbi:MAG TPA: bifunctional adenosylcobinamide kinase/adenosylcobinamide-phosphate guanylyltransferase [Novimethylophilus sp.]|jgi:adenosylcobinamide kinase/adenosylcobinamide-phosphate guanylyltransferase|uniref:bifunctional adenosylcobinamide kinase/adenosylcobinamide-phosphate guanylyltransferase n=1 Tax=Novimethylophilus sp. TaxID=2137426 RepID=UPI002F40C343
MRELILGGARSGKSAYAERLAICTGLPVTYIATAQVWDDEMAARVRHHQERRPDHWRIVEEPFHLADTLKAHAKSGQCVVVDCLTLWLAQWICPDCKSPQEGSWTAERALLLELLPTFAGKIVLVSNEVGMGIVPLGEINRRFQDEQGRLNQAVAAACEHVTFIAAGLPLQLKG